VTIGSRPQNTEGGRSRTEQRNALLSDLLLGGLKKGRRGRQGGGVGYRLRLAAGRGPSIWSSTIKEAAAIGEALKACSIALPLCELSESTRRVRGGGNLQKAETVLRRARKEGAGEKGYSKKGKTEEIGMSYKGVWLKWLLCPVEGRFLRQKKQDKRSELLEEEKRAGVPGRHRYPEKTLTISTAAMRRKDEAIC